MRKINYQPIMTIQRSGSHFLANIAINKLDGLVLTTSIERINEPEITEYRPDVIKRGLIDKNNFKPREGINSIYLFSHPHHFKSLQDYYNFLGEEKINIVLSYPFDSLYSLFLATTQGYRDKPTKETIQELGARKIYASDIEKLIGYAEQVRFTRDLFKCKNKEKVNVHKYEEMNDANISRILGNKIENSGFCPDKKRIFWSRNFTNFSADAIKKIERDFSELIENCYQL